MKITKATALNFIRPNKWQVVLFIFLVPMYFLDSWGLTVLTKMNAWSLLGGIQVSQEDLNLLFVGVVIDTYIDRAFYRIVKRYYSIPVGFLRNLFKSRARIVE